MDENQISKNKSTEGSQSSSFADPRLKHSFGATNSILRYFQILYINKWLFIGVLILVLGAFVFYALRQPKLYESQYEVFYNESIREFMAESDVPVIKSDFDKNFWLSTMRSDEIARLTIEHLGLSYKTEDLKKMLKVEIIDKKKEDRIPVYKVSITSPDKVLNSKVLVAYVKALNDLLLKNQVSNSEKLVSFLRNQLNDNGDKLNEIDRQILGYSNSNPERLMDVSSVSANLESFHTNLLNTRINLSSIRASRQRTEHELQNLDGTIVDESSFSEPLKVQLMNLEVDLARALTKSKEDHPSIKAIRNNIRQINIMLRDSIEQRMEIKSLMQNPVKSQLMSKLAELKIAEIAEESKLNSLEKVISELGQKMLPNAIDETQQQLLRNRDMIFMTIKELNSKLIEAQCSSQGSLCRFVVIDEPLQSSPTNKNILFYIITGLIIGALLAGAIVYIYDLLDNRLMLISDYENFYSIPLLAVTTHYKSKDESWFNYGDTSPDKEKYTSELSNLVSNIRNVVRKTGNNVFAIYSPVRREGKSLVSLQTALSLADRRMKVLLVDIDFFSPKLTRLFNMKSEMGLTDYFSEKCNMEDIIHPTEHENLSFTSVGTLKMRDNLGYDEPFLSDFIDYAKGQYDVIIFDTPALLYIPDIVNFMDKIERVILIVRLGHTTRSSLDRMLNILHNYRTKITGVVLNDLKNNFIGKYSDYYHYEYYDKDVEGDNTESQQKTQSSSDDDRGFFYNLFHAKWTWIILGIIVIGVLGFFSTSFLSGLNLTAPFGAKKTEVVEPVVAPLHLQATDTSSVIAAVDTTILTPPVAMPQHQPAVASEYIDTVKIEHGLRLTLISLKYYGSKQFWVYIYLANKDRIADPSNISIGTQVYIPRPEKYGIDATNKKSLDEAAVLQTKIINKEL